jgi:hypothetical protein
MVFSVLMLAGRGENRYKVRFADLAPQADRGCPHPPERR